MKPALKSLKKRKTLFKKKKQNQKEVIIKSFYFFDVCLSVTSQIVPVLFWKDKFLIESVVDMNMFPKIYDSMKLGFGEILIFH